MIKIIDPVMFKILSLEIRWYGFLIISSLLISLIILKYILKRDNSVIDFEFFLDFIIFALPAAVIGARLYYVVFNLEYYWSRPAKILAIQEGGLAIHGALIFAAAVLYIMAKKQNVSFLKSLDYLAPLMSLGQSIGRWGNFINQEAYGRIISSDYYDFFPNFIKNQMFIDGHYREAAFLYESIADFLLFLFLFFYLKKDSRENGDVLAFYLIFYSVFRYFIEELRTDSLLIFGLQTAQLMSILMIILGVYILIKNHLYKKIN